MFHNLAVDIALILISNKIIDVEERDVYVYGLEVLILNLSLVVIFLAMSLVFGLPIHFIACLIFFFPIRVVSGGYHASTGGQCFVLSTITYAMTLAAIYFVPSLYTSVYAMAAGIVSVVMIFLFAPIINKNNELNSQQVRNNKIAMRIILFIDLVLFILCYLMNWKIASSELVFIMFACILLLIEKIRLSTQHD